MMYIYTTIQKFSVGKIFVMFLRRKEICSPRFHLFDKKNAIKNSNTVKFKISFPFKYIKKIY